MTPRSGWLSPTYPNGTLALRPHRGRGGAVRRTVMSALVAVVALGVAALGAPAAQAAPPPGYQPPPVAWGPCTDPRLADKADCGVVTDPLYYPQAAAPKT